MRDSSSASVAAVQRWVAAAAAACWLSSVTIGAQVSREAPTPAPVNRCAELPESGGTSVVSRLLAAYDRMGSIGLCPTLSTVVSGSGLAFGLEYRSPVRQGFSFDGGVRWSVRTYRDYRFSAGWRSRPSLSTALGPFAPAVPRRAFDHSPTTGLAVYVDARRFIHPRLDFYGLTPDDAEQGFDADFSVTGTDVSVASDWQPTTEVTVSGRVGSLTLSQTRGTNDSMPDVGDAYSSGAAPGFGVNGGRYWMSGAGVAWQRAFTKDDPSVRRGDRFTGDLRDLRVVLAGQLWHAASRVDDLASFTRRSLTAHVLVPIGHDDRQAVAAQARYLSDRTSDESIVPFPLQASLGGSQTLRAFPTYRFRGTQLVHGSLEYRHRIWRPLQAVAFVDVGRAGLVDEAVDVRPTRSSWGIGLRTERPFAFRLEFAVSGSHRRLFVAFDRRY